MFSNKGVTQAQMRFFCRIRFSFRNSWLRSTRHLLCEFTCDPDSIIIKPLFFLLGIHSLNTFSCWAFILTKLINWFLSTRVYFSSRRRFIFYRRLKIIVIQKGRSYFWFRFFWIFINKWKDFFNSCLRPDCIMIFVNNQFFKISFVFIGDKMSILAINNVIIFTV